MQAGATPSSRAQALDNPVDQLATKLKGLAKDADEQRVRKALQRLPTALVPSKAGSSVPTFCSIPYLLSTPVWLSFTGAQPLAHPVLAAWNTETDVHNVFSDIQLQRDAILDEFYSLRDAANESKDPDVMPSVIFSKTGKWEQLHLVEEGRWHTGNCSKCPVTKSLLDKLPICFNSLGFVYFSVLQPGTQVAAHSGPTNLRLRAQFCLQGNSKATVRVAGLTHHSTTGSWLLFDDSFQHEAANLGNGERVVLLIDLYHPQLGNPERSLVAQTFSPSLVEVSEDPQLPPSPNTASVGLRPTEPASRVHCHLLDVAHSVLTQSVVQFLGPQDVGALMCCCKHLSLLLGDNVMWRLLCGRDFGSDVSSDVLTYAQKELDETKESHWPPTSVSHRLCPEYLLYRCASADLLEELPKDVSPMQPSKMVLAGLGGAGKTSYIHRIRDNTFPPYICTIGVDFTHLRYRWRGRNIKVQLWDTAGPERYRSLSPIYYRGADVVFVVYDVTDLSSLEDAKRTITSIPQQVQAKVILVGNKSDLCGKPIERNAFRSTPVHDHGLVPRPAPHSQGAVPRHPTLQEVTATAQSVARRFGVQYIIISAKTGARCRHAMRMGLAHASAAIDRRVDTPLQGPHITVPPPPKKWCVIS